MRKEILCFVLVILFTCITVSAVDIVEVIGIVYEDDLWFDRPGEFPGDWMIDKADSGDLKESFVVVDAPNGMIEYGVVMRTLDEIGEGRVSTRAFDAQSEKLLVETQILVTQADFDRAMVRRGEDKLNDMQAMRIMVRKAGVWPPLVDFKTGVGSKIGALGILDDGKQGWSYLDASIEPGKVTKLSILLDFAQKTFSVAIDECWIEGVLPFRKLDAEGGPYVLQLYIHPDWYIPAYVAPFVVSEVK